MSKCKYILVKDTHGKSAIVFGSTLKHSDIARELANYEVLSAGFVNIYSEHDEVQVKCYGESTSLKLKANESDSFYVKFAMGLIQ